MTSEPFPRLRHHGGTRWLHLAVVVSLLAGGGYGMLDALLDAQELSERTVVELTWRDMRVGLQIAKGEALIGRRDNEILQWVGGNPVRWLATVPEGYRGECSAREAELLERGAWCFDRERHELVYRPRNTRYLRLVDGAEGLKLLRWRTALPSGEMNRSGQIPGLRVELVTPYVWGEE